MVNATPSVVGLESSLSHERTRLLLQALLARVCAHLELDPKIETAEPGDGAQFALLQTIEEHRHPEFLYSSILDRELLAGS